MLREQIGKQIGVEDGFRHRGTEPGRLENFSDAIFALAVTLLLISTSAPTNFEQIRKFVFELIPFAICIALIVLIWYQHFTFYFRYGIRSGPIVVLNSVFLIIVLFYVYPLKFLAKLSLYVVVLLFDLDWLRADLRAMIHSSDMRDLMIIYGLGAASVFLILALMYRYALRQTDKLQLDELEIFLTRSSLRTNLLLACVPALSVAVAIAFHSAIYVGAYAGFVYFLYPIIMAAHGVVEERRKRKLMGKLMNSSSISIENQESKP